MKSLVVVGALLVLQGPSTESRDDRSGSLAGIVSTVGSGRTVARADVRLGHEDGRTQSAITDAGGRFAFDQVPPGSWRLTVARDGYVPAEYGQTAPNRSGEPIVVRAGERQGDIIVQMTPTGVISGHVRDIYGESVVEATVEALAFSYQDGRRILTPVRSASTNDLGEYRLFWLQPGEYVVRVAGGAALSGTMAIRADASGAIQMFASSPWRSDSGTAHTPVYYPGTTDPSQAVVVIAGAGREFSGIDIVQAEVSGTRLRGRVLPGSDGALPPGINITLVSAADLIIQGGERTRARLQPDGTFEITGVLPGRYALMASTPAVSNVTSSAGTDGNRQDGVVATRQRFFASLPVDVGAGAASIDDLVLQLAPGFTLTGRISAPTGMAGDLTAARVAVWGDATTLGTFVNPAPVAADGAFQLTGLPPGDYRLVVQGLPAEVYAASARLGAAEALDSGFRVDAAMRASLDIRLMNDVGSVTVVASGPDGVRAPDARVVLIPDTVRRGRPDAYRSGLADPNGVIRFDNVAPGDYTVIAWEDVPTGAWENAAFLQRFEDQGVPVRLAPSGREQAEVAVVR